MLECSWECLENAGYNPNTYQGINWYICWRKYEHLFDQ
ncbi:MAG UNVERIFIED_CONTAM: hypothetical protein LVR29_13200 [Microcystis novacekii LVE1205-3]